MVFVLLVCIDLGVFEVGKWVGCYLERERVYKSVEFCNVLINMFVKCGDVDKVLRVFRSMDEKDIVLWIFMFIGLRMNGNGVEVILLFEEMKIFGVVFNDVVFIGLFDFCCYVGLVD